jgi:HK97 family phage portal protein
MIIRTPGGGTVQIRSQMFGGTDVIPMPSQETGSFSNSGRRVSAASSVGLPAMLRAITVKAEILGVLPLLVYQNVEDERLRARETSQWRLLHDKPNDIQTPYAFKRVVAAHRIAHGNAYIMKAKHPKTGEVLALYILHPSRVTPKCVDGVMEYKVRQGTEPAVTLYRDSILHIPGMLLDDPYIGVSPILVAANAVGAALAGEEYAGRFYSNDATPGGVIEMPFGADTQVARDTKEVWDDGHRGSKNAHKTGVLFGGATYKQIGLDAQAAQIVESQRWNVDQTARVIGLPAWILGGTDLNPRATPEQRSEDLVRYSILPETVGFEQAIVADDDLFPDKSLGAEFLVEGLMRAELAARYAAYLQARQAGWLSVNDIRRKENEPGIGPAGDEYQSTPVGGAPNLQPGANPDAVEPSETDA